MFAFKKTILFSIFLLCGFGFLQAEAATLALRPGAGSYALGENFTLRVVLDSPGQPANAVSGKISFPNNQLHVVSVSKGPAINFWVTEPSFSNNEGTIQFEGVTFNPGFTGNGGSVLTIVFQGEGTGQVPVTFSSGSVLANDGQGTDITEGTEGATITLTPRRSPAPTLEAVTITSPTHPNQNQWYALNEPKFELSFASHTQAISYVLDQTPTSTPPAVSQEIISSYQSSELSSGEWYFHARAKQTLKWSDASHFRVRIDSQPPESFSIKLTRGSSMTELHPEIVFGTTDALSGIDHYAISINNQPWTLLHPSSSEPYQIVELPYQLWGRREVRVQAFDQAGNIREEQIEFLIEVNWLLLLTIFIVLILLTILVWFVVFGWRAGKKKTELMIRDLLPEKVDLDLFKQSEAVNQDLEQLYTDLRNLLALKSQHKAFFYLREARARNLTNEQIRQELHATGWSDEEIISLFWEERAISTISEKIKNNLKDLGN